jgi:hypothetical protein
MVGGIMPKQMPAVLVVEKLTNALDKRGLRVLN